MTHPWKILAIALCLALPGWTLAEDDNPDDAAADVRQAVMQLMGWNMGTVAAMSTGKAPYDQARALLGRALADAASAGDRAEVHQEWAAVEIESGDHRAAFSHLKSALGERPRDARSWELMGRLLLEREDWRQAERAYREALRIDPARASALYGLGRIAEERGDYSQAALHFAKAARKAPWRDHYQESLERTKRLAGDQQDNPAAR